MTIRDGVSVDDVTPLATLCGRRAPLTVFSSQNALRLQLMGFDADDDVSIHVRYESIGENVTVIYE